MRQIGMRQRLPDNVLTRPVCLQVFCGKAAVIPFTHHGWYVVNLSRKFLEKKNGSEQGNVTCGGDCHGPEMHRDIRQYMSVYVCIDQHTLAPLIGWKTDIDRDTYSTDWERPRYMCENIVKYHAVLVALLVTSITRRHVNQDALWKLTRSAPLERDGLTEALGLPHILPYFTTTKFRTWKYLCAYVVSGQVCVYVYIEMGFIPLECTQICNTPWRQERIPARIIVSRCLLAPTSRASQGIKISSSQGIPFLTLPTSSFSLSPTTKSNLTT